MTGLADLSGAWAAAVWRASWQGGLAPLVVWAVCRLVPTMPARFQSWLWRLVVLKFAVALLWSVPIGVPLLPASEPATVGLHDRATSVRTGAESAPVVRHKPSGLVTPWLLAFLAWSVVVGCQAVRILRACRAAHRLRSGGRPSANQQLLRQLAVAGKSFGFDTPPAVLEVDGDGSPMLVGLLRPAIVVPTTTLSRLDDRERAMVIGHELAHARRGDLVWGLIAAAVRAVFFFHPLAWLSERQLGATQEIAADELAVARQNYDPFGYATLLVSVVSKLGPDRVLPAMSVGAAGSHQSLKRRLFAMRFMKPSSRRVVAAYGIALGLVAVLGVVPWAVVAAEPPAADKPRTEDKPRPADKPRTTDETAPKEGRTVSGEFVSFKEGVLRIQGKTKETEWEVAGDTKTVSIIRGVEQEGVAQEAFKRWEPGAVISVRVKDGKVTSIQIGVKKGPAADKVEQKEGVDRGRNSWGKFVSFKEGTLTLKANSGALVEVRIPENAKTLVWNHDEGRYEPKGTADALHQAKAGTLIGVQGANETVTVRVGTRRGRTVGTFVSFKDDRLLILGKDFPASFTKKYGNSVHFKKFAETIPVYESIDGGEYKLAGTPSTVLGNVKEGTIITVHSEGDDNFTLIQIGVSKKE